jgi:ABC-2 type transport system permease protein
VSPAVPGEGPTPATLVRLKLLLLRNGFRRSSWQLVAFVLGCVWAAGLVLAGGGGLIALRFAPVDLAGPVVVGGATLLVLGWAFLPLVAFGVDETLDPARFATFAVPRRTLVPGLLLGGLVGIPGAATALLALAAVVALSRSVPATAFALLALAVAVLTAVAASRTTTTLAAAVLRGRRARDALAVLGGVLAVGVGPGLNLALTRAGDVVRLGRAIAGVAGWTPPGFAAAAAADAAAGRWGGALLRLLLALAVLAALLGTWAAVLGPTGTGPARGGGRGRTRVDTRRHPVLDRLPATPAVAVALRCSRYWRRDPRYLLSAASLLVIPLLVVVLPATQGRGFTAWLLVAGPALALVAGWSLHDDVAYDHSAFALHVATGLRGRDDRAGRVLAAGLWQVPAVVVVAAAGALLGGRAEAVPAVLGASLALLGAGYGVSSVASALAPYPAPAPGANPFQSPRGAGAAAVLAQLATSALTSALALPALVPAVAALLGPAWAGWIALVVGAGLAGLWTWLGITRGGAVLDRRGPEVLARVGSS